MRTRKNSNTQRHEPRRRGARVAVVAIALALVALVALSSGGMASAAAHPKHPKHSPHPTPTTPAFALDFTCAQAWNQVLGVICVKTVPSATLSIKVTTCGHTAPDASLKGTAQADSKGQYVWDWTPNTTCTSGKATVTAKSGGKTVTKSTTFAIAANPGV